MKKIVTGFVALAMAASMFAVDFSATVKMDANIASKNGDGVDFLTLNKKDQKDNDALIISANGEKAGGQFQLWYTYDGTNGENSYKDLTKQEAGTSAGPWEDNNVVSFHGLRLRSVNVWFKPIDSLKVTVGDTAIDGYKEHIFWWHGVYGAKPGSWGAFGGNYLEGNGFKVEFNGVENLELAAIFLPGVGNAQFSTESGYKAFGAKAKYNFGVANATVMYADKGDGSNKIIGVGGEYGNEYADGFYAFLNVNMNLNNGALQAIAFDNAETFNAGALKIQAHLPVVLYDMASSMKVGMYASLKVAYGLGSCTPYFLATNEPDGDAGWCFDAFKFDMTFQPGVTFNVGSAAFDIAARIDIKDGKFDTWKVPCVIKVGL